MIPLVVILLAPNLPGDLAAAAQDLARTVAAVFSRGAVALDVRNMSSLPADAAVTVRHIFESELNVTDPAAAVVEVTISENLTQFLLVADIKAGLGDKVLIASFPRAAASVTPATGPPQVTLEKKLVWEQDQPILDAAESGGAWLILDALRVLLVRGEDRQSAPIPATHPWPRDMRGHLTASDAAFTAYLPGTICQGATRPQLSLDCRNSQDPWLIAPCALATFAPDRNLFSGRVDFEPGGPRDLPPFYSATPAGDAWIVAAADGRALVYSATWDSPAVIEQWGSDIAAIATPCGPRILATRATSLAEDDAIRPYAIADHMPNPSGPALEFSGPVTALWSAANSATAISKDLQTGRYAAYSLAPACGF